ncbi:MAG TPA: pyridoxamine 5'-phosphate oxidase family protein [Acidimicrobiales bacterium]|nr:pyridoxamine 5'-phosphate oxidase family protein [Acidimicrobiales bacterium]
MTQPETDHRGSEVLSASICWELLTAVHGRVGRVAFHDRERLDLRPVNYAVRDGSLLVRVGPGSMLEAILDDPQAVFETDAVDMYSSPPRAWSVVAHGRLEPVHVLSELAEAMAVDLHPLAARPGDVYLVMKVDSVSGRRFFVNDLARPGLEAILDMRDPAEGPRH